MYVTKYNIRVEQSRIQFHTIVIYGYFTRAVVGRKIRNISRKNEHFLFVFIKEKGRVIYFTPLPFRSSVSHKVTDSMDE